MQPHVLHFPIPDPTPKPVPHPEPPPPFPPGAALPMSMVHVGPAWAYRHVQRPLTGVVVEGATVQFFYQRPVR